MGWTIGEGCVKIVTRQAVVDAQSLRSSFFKNLVQSGTIMKLDRLFFYG